MGITNDHIKQHITIYIGEALPSRRKQENQKVKTKNESG